MQQIIKTIEIPTNIVNPSRTSSGEAIDVRKN